VTAPLISPEARLGRNVEVGAGTRIHGTVEIGEASTIGDHCVIGHPAARPAGSLLRIGARAVIRSHTIVYEGSDIGPGLQTGHHVVIREGTRAGEGLRVGNFSDIEGECEIGDFCRFHGYVHLGRGTRVGHFVWLYSLVVTLNDPLPPSHLADPAHIGDGVVLAVGCLVMPGARVGAGAFATNGTRVAGEIPPGAVVTGDDCRVVNHVGRLMHLASGTRHPWMQHFADAYPPHAQGRIKALLDIILENRMTLRIEEDRR
jgi:UDP-3-O-[3-hydroxymyristoyl] glucosamine N-acyltransferase